MASGRAGRLQQANAESHNVRDTIVAAGFEGGTAVEVLQGALAISAQQHQDLGGAIVAAVDSYTHGTEDANPQELGAAVTAVTDDFEDATIHADPANTVRSGSLGPSVGMKSVENQVDSCSSATQDCNASEFVDGDQADSEDVTVVDGVTFINGVAVSDTNHEKKGGVDMAQKPKQKEQKSEPKVPSVAARTRSALKTGNQEPRQNGGVPPKKSSSS